MSFPCSVWSYIYISKSCRYLFVVSTVTPSVYASSPFSASSWPYSYPVVTVSTLESLKIPLTSLQLQGTVHFSRSPERAQNMLTLDHWPETECLMEDMSKKLETNSQQVSVVVCFLPICVPIVSSSRLFRCSRMAISMSQSWNFCHRLTNHEATNELHS